MRLKLSIWSSYYVDLTVEEAIERLLQNGICCSELSDEHGYELLSRSDDISEPAKKFSAFLKERSFEIYCGVFNLEIPGERKIPLELRDAKLAYIKACYDYLMT